MNPFDTSAELDEANQFINCQEFNTSFPVCLTDTVKNLDSPIERINFDVLSQHFMHCELFSTKEQLERVKLMKTSFKEVTTYTEILEKRHLEMAMELEREKLKSQQLMNALSFIKSNEEKTSDAWSERNRKSRENQEAFNKLLVVHQKSENEMGKLKSENNYLKELIFVANENYEKLSVQFAEACQRITMFQTEKDDREQEMIKKMTQVKEIFANLLIAKPGNCCDKPQLKKQEPLSNITNHFQSTTKTSTKKEVEDTYRQIFIKTLKNRKQNK